MIGETFVQSVCFLLVLNSVFANPLQNLRYFNDERLNIKSSYDQLRSRPMPLRRGGEGFKQKFIGQGQYDDVSYHEVLSNKNEVGKQQREVYTGVGAGAVASSGNGHRDKRFTDVFQRVFEEGTAAAGNVFQGMASTFNTTSVREGIDKFKNAAGEIFNSGMQAGSTAVDAMGGAAQGALNFATGSRRKREIHSVETKFSNNLHLEPAQQRHGHGHAKCRGNNQGTTTEDPTAELFRRKRDADDAPQRNTQGYGHNHKSEDSDVESRRPKRQTDETSDVKETIRLRTHPKSGPKNQESEISRQKRENVQGELNELEDLGAEKSESGGFFEKIATTFVNIFKQFLKWLNE